MNLPELINLSLEQTVERIEDPVNVVFALMYERFPELLAYKEAYPNWENYMFEEIITNFLQFCDDPATASLTIKDMTVHHELIGVPRTIFSGLYEVMYEVVSQNFHGPKQPEMDASWRALTDQIRAVIEKAA